MSRKKNCALQLRDVREVSPNEYIHQVLMSLCDELEEGQGRCQVNLNILSICIQKSGKQQIENSNRQEEALISMSMRVYPAVYRFAVRNLLSWRRCVSVKVEVVESWQETSGVHVTWFCKSLSLNAAHIRKISWALNIRTTLLDQHDNIVKEESWDAWFAISTSIFDTLPPLSSITCFRISSHAHSLACVWKIYLNKC
jgi:hypothetical protein